MSNCRRHSRRLIQSGLSLVELMVALVLGVILLIGVIEVFGSTRAAYEGANALSRVQEGGRFGMEFLLRDLRMAGHWGCFGDYGRSPPGTTGQVLQNHFSTTMDDTSAAPWAFRTDLAIEGYEFVGTAPGESYELDAEPAPSGNAGDWSPALPADLDIVDDALPGSDVVVVRFASPDFVPIDFYNPGANEISVAPGDAGFVEQNAAYMLNNCRSFSLFQASTAPDGNGDFTVLAANQNEFALADNPDTYDAPLGVPGGGAPMHRYNLAAYYVAEGTGGQPSLFRKRLVVEGGQYVLSDPEELIEGVEALQFTYAVSEVPDLVRLGQVQSLDVYLPADELNGAGAVAPDRWRRVQSMRVGLLIRSPDRAVSEEPALPWMVGNTQLTIDEHDERIREVYEAVVTIRNRT